MNIGKENEQIEFKTSLAEQKQGFESIASILNKHQSGTLYFGVLDDGEVKGIQIGKDTLNHLSRDLELYIKPLFSHSIRLLNTDNGLEFIEISFSGTNTPYSAYDRYYLRFADRDRGMNQEMLQNYFERKRLSYVDWENNDSSCGIDCIEECSLKSYIERGNLCGRIKFLYDDKIKVLNRLGLLFSDSSLNNAGKALFSSQKPIQVKLSTFASERKTTIVDMNHFSGNIFECIDMSMKYISSHLDWNIVFDGKVRSKEICEIPMEAVREIVVNAFAHGSYESISTNFEICIYKDRLTIYSPGHFPKPYTPEEFAYKGQEAIPLNNKICNVLYNDETIEEQSTGFERTFEYCGKRDVQYSYEDTGLGFRFTFFRKVKNEKSRKILNEREEKIKFLLCEEPSITIHELSKNMNVTEKTIYRSLKKMKELEIISRKGSDREGYWIVHEDNK